MKPNLNMIDMMMAALAAHTTPKSINKKIARFCKTLNKGSHAPVFLTYAEAGYGYKAGYCHANSLHYVRKHGGEVLPGWVIWHSVFTEAEHHSVVRTLDGKILDVTPRPDGEEKLLFVPSPDHVWDAEFTYPNVIEGMSGLQRVPAKLNSTSWLYFLSFGLADVLPGANETHFTPKELQRNAFLAEVSAAVHCRK